MRLKIRLSFSKTLTLGLHFRISRPDYKGDSWFADISFLLWTLSIDSYVGNK